jgi:DNA polymerase elongation subunit (family B)
VPVFTACVPKNRTKQAYKNGIRQIGRVYKIADTNIIKRIYRFVNSFEKNVKKGRRKMQYIIKTQTIELGKTLKELHSEVAKLGVDVDYGDFCNYIKGKKPGNAADRAKEAAYAVIDGWKTKRKET